MSATSPHRKLDEWPIRKEEKIMNMNEPSQHKVEKPSANFKTGHEVVADPALSKPEKEKALDALEQDARLLATASAEGMTGGDRGGKCGIYRVAHDRRRRRSLGSSPRR